MGAGCLLVLLTPVILIALYAWFYQPYDLKSQDALNIGYQVEFLSPPPLGVQVLKGRQIIVRDAGGQYLLMKMTTAEIDRHIKMGFERVDDPPDDFKNLGQGNRPDWWQMPLPKGTEYYQNLSWNKQGWNEARAYIAVRSSNGNSLVILRKIVDGGRTSLPARFARPGNKAPGPPIKVRTLKNCVTFYIKKVILPSLPS